MRGMGEKQIEVDKRLLRTRISALRRSLEEVRRNRQLSRDRRAQVRLLKPLRLWLDSMAAIVVCWPCFCR